MKKDSIFKFYSKELQVAHLPDEEPILRNSERLLLDDAKKVNEIWKLKPWLDKLRDNLALSPEDFN